MRNRALHLDFETRSTVDLQAAGAYVYARDPSTSILCAAYSFDDFPVKYWPAAAGKRMPADLMRALKDPGIEVHAWNAQFERLILAHVLGIDVSLLRFRCTAALARARGLPGKLETALDFVGLGEDLAVKRKGKALMMKWCKPLKDGGWADDPSEYVDLIAYCIGDVKSERTLGRRLYPLSPVELDEYMHTELINDRGLPIDVPLAIAAQGYGEEEKRELSAYMGWMTGGSITSVNQHARVKAWLKRKLGLDLFDRFFVKGDKESTDKNARADFLGSEAAKDADPEVIELIEVIDDAGKSSVSKFGVMAARAADTGRAEGSYLCYGAAQTKRYSSRGVQMHNLLRKGPPDLVAAIDQVMRHQVPGKVMHALAALLRPAIKAPPGRKLIWGDWAAVEARGMPWLADCQWKLDLYREGVDVYRVNAQDIFAVEPDEATDQQRQIGKVAELSLQFGGAKGALKAMGRGYGITLRDGQAEEIVLAWRAANPWAAEYSYGLYYAFLRACLDGEASHGPVTYRQIDPILPGTVSMACDLPGGTSLYYHGIKGHIGLRDPGLRRSIHVSIGDGTAGYNGEDFDGWETEVVFSKTLPAGFRTERIWHGLFAENTTQALCAALLRDCLGRVEVRMGPGEDMLIIGHTHDEIIVEASERGADIAARILQEEMRRVPKWLPGFPLDCTVTVADRYGK